MLLVSMPVLAYYVYRLSEEHKKFLLTIIASTTDRLQRLEDKIQNELKVSVDNSTQALLQNTEAIKKSEATLTRSAKLLERLRRHPAFKPTLPPEEDEEQL